MRLARNLRLCLNLQIKTRIRIFRMTSLIQKISLFSCISLSLAACSATSLDNNAEKIQTQPTSTANQKKLITVHQVSAAGIGESIGTVSFEETAKGLLITPGLGKLSEGEHGFHIHENASCRRFTCINSE